MNEEKKNALTSQTVVVASSLSSLETPTADSIHDISVKCGFANQTSFNRCFRQIMGMSPNRYRAGNDTPDPAE